MYLSDENFSCPKGQIMDKHLRLTLTVLIPNANFFGFFGLMLYVLVTSYGHIRTVSSSNHTTFLDKLDQALNQYLVHILLLVTDHKASCMSRREENGHRNYFMINLQESMGPGPDRTRDLLICGQTQSADRHVTNCAMLPSI